MRLHQVALQLQQPTQERQYIYKIILQTLPQQILLTLIGEMEQKIPLQTTQRLVAKVVQDWHTLITTQRRMTEAQLQEQELVIPSTQSS